MLSGVEAGLGDGESMRELNRMRDAQQEEGPCEAGGKVGGGGSCSAP